MDWKEIFKSEGLTQGRKLHSKYEFNIDKINSPIITICLWEQFNGYFYATTDYAVRNSKQSTPCKEENVNSSPEEALSLAIKGITTWIQEPYDKIKFIKKDFV